MDERISKGVRMYYARILSLTDVYELCDLRIRTVEETYFVGVDTDTHVAYLFYNKDIDKNVFFNRSKALEKVKEAKKHRKDNINHANEIINELIQKEIENRN